MIISILSNVLFPVNILKYKHLYLNNFLQLIFISILLFLYQTYIFYPIIFIHNNKYHSFHTDSIITVNTCWSFTRIKYEITRSKILVTFFRPFFIYIYIYIYIMSNERCKYYCTGRTCFRGSNCRYEHDNYEKVILKTTRTRSN